MSLLGHYVMELGISTLEYNLGADHPLNGTRVAYTFNLSSSLDLLITKWINTSKTIKFDLKFH